MVVNFRALRPSLGLNAPRVALTLTICKVWDAEYPWDVRVEKVARSLRDAGHVVHLAARNRRGEPTFEELAEASVHRLSLPGWLPRKAAAASMFPAFFNPRWLRLIRRVATHSRADLILCRDLPLAVPCIRVGRRLGIPVVLDMAENYPAMMQALWETGRVRPLDGLVRNPRAVRLVEEWVLKRIDGVMVVVEESGARLIELGVPPERIVLVSNTPPLGRLRQPGPLERAPSGDPLRMVYLGLLEAPRGVMILLDAVALLARERLPVRLTVIGDGREAEVFRRHTASLALAPGVIEFRGRLPNEVALREVAGADVGVVPHWKNESWDTTIPNKLFDYMAAGLAVVTSNCLPAARIVREARAGLVFQDRNAPDLAAQIRRLADPTVRAECGRAGRRAVRELHHWEADSARMVDFLERIVAGRSRRAQLLPA